VLLPNDCGILLLPETKESEIGRFSGLGEAPVRGVRGYRYQQGKGAELIFLADTGNPWTCGKWASDAKLLYCRVEDCRLTHIVMLSGTFAEWGGKRFVTRPSRTEIFEWVSPDLDRRVSSGNLVSDGSIVSTFEVFDSVS
jgi:hypothetical protein